MATEKHDNDSNNDNDYGHNNNNIVLKAMQWPTRLAPAGRAGATYFEKHKNPDMHKLCKSRSLARSAVKALVMPNGIPSVLHQARYT